QLREAEVAEAVTRVLDVAGVGPALAQHVRGRGDGEEVVDVAAAAGDELQPAVVHVVGLLVGELQAGGVPAVEPGKGGDAVLQGQGLALLRVVHLRQRLVPARVEVAALDAQAHAGTAVGAVAQAGGVDAALGRLQRDADRHLVVGARLVRFRDDVDTAEVVEAGERGAQPVDVLLVVGLARVPRHQLFQQLRADDLRGLGEVHFAHRVARAAGPQQVDVGGQLGARDLDPVALQFRVEVAAFGQAAADQRLAGAVADAVEDLARRRLETGDRLAHVAVRFGVALEGDLAVAHPHRFAGDHGDHHRAALAVALDLDLRRVVAERLQRLAGLV